MTLFVLFFPLSGHLGPPNTAKQGKPQNDKSTCLTPPQEESQELYLMGVIAPLIPDTHPHPQNVLNLAFLLVFLRNYGTRPRNLVNLLFLRSTQKEYLVNFGGMGVGPVNSSASTPGCISSLTWKVSSAIQDHFAPPSQMIFFLRQRSALGKEAWLPWGSECSGNTRETQKGCRGVSNFLGTSIGFLRSFPPFLRSQPHPLFA